MAKIGPGLRVRQRAALEEASSLSLSLTSIQCQWLFPPSHPHYGPGWGVGGWKEREREEVDGSTELYGLLPDFRGFPVSF